MCVRYLSLILVIFNLEIFRLYGTLTHFQLQPELNVLSYNSNTIPCTMYDVAHIMCN